MSNEDDTAGDPRLVVTGGPLAVGRYAVLGHPTGHSRSPELHNAWFHAAGLPSTYEPVDISPDDLVRHGPALPFQWSGMNITSPHKVTILGYVDTVDSNARAAGAANLLYRNQQGAWAAGNTDGQGFVSALHNHLGESIAGRDVVILGAGGAARAIAVSLAAEGVSSLHIVNRSRKHADDVAELVGGANVHDLHPEFLDALDVSIDVIINTLPPAGEGFVGAVDLAPLPASALVADINYYVERPALLDRGKAAGLKTMDGRPMFLWQAALSFHAWTQMQPDLDLGRRILAGEYLPGD
jgi:shikimate dehydrogenase